MENVKFWTAQVGTVFIWQNWLYRKLSEATAIACNTTCAINIQPYEEIVPITEEDIKTICKTQEEHLQL